MSALLILELLRIYFTFEGSLLGRSADAGAAIAGALPSAILGFKVAWVSYKNKDKHQRMVLDMAIMDLEEDGPPDLVDVSGLNKPAPSHITLQMQDLGLSKVPLTIVTGRVQSMTIILPFMIAR